MRFGVTSTTPATRRRNFLGEDRKSGVAHTGKVAGRLLADFAFRYDAAGRLVKEGDKTYRYGYLDKVLSVTEGPRTYTYDYHVDGQLARAVYGNGTGDDGRAVSTKPPPPASSEDFLWDGLALIKRGDERFVNEPHVGGGNPVTSSKGTTYFNDILGTTVGIREGRAPSRPKSPRYSAAALTAFGESIPASQPLNTSTSQQFFTGKPQVAGLGHAFLFRNYRASLGKWQTADPLGYPDGENQFSYCNNGVTCAVDIWGGWSTAVHHDINQTYLNDQEISQTAYQWGRYSLNVLGSMDSGSDWTDSFLGGNQADDKAYMHAMASSWEGTAGASFRWNSYLNELKSQAKSYSDSARALYNVGRYNDALAMENLAIEYLGRLSHTYDDSFAPAHARFQCFSEQDKIWHWNLDQWDVYVSGAYVWYEHPENLAYPYGDPGRRETVYQAGGFRDYICQALVMKYAETVRHVLRQPE